MKKPVNVKVNDNIIFINGNINKELYDSFLKEYKNFSIYQELIIDLTTTGGEALFAYLFAILLLNHKGKVIIRVPSYALSAGTIIAMAGDELLVNNYTFFSGINAVSPGFGIEFNQMLKMVNEYLKFKDSNTNHSIAELISTFIKNKSSNVVKCHQIEISRILEKSKNVKETFKGKWQKFDHDTLLDYDEIINIFENVKLIC